MEFRNGVNAEKAAYGSGVPFINVLEVITKSHLTLSDVPGRIALTRAETVAYGVRRGDVVFNRTSETQEEVGLASVFLGDEEAVFGGFVLRGRPLPGAELDPVYSGYGLRAPDVRKQIVARGQGAIRANVGQADLREVIVAVPPLPEQRAIAAALSDVDALIAALDKLIAKKRDLKTATMQQLLTGQRRLPGFTGAWEVKRLGDYGRCLRGVSYDGDQDLFASDTPTSVRLLRSNNVQDSRVNVDDVQYVNRARVSETQMMRSGDILVCMANGSKELVGKAGHFDVNDGAVYTFGAFMGCFRAAAAGVPRFVAYLLQTRQYRAQIANILAGSSINNLRPAALEALEFSMPPVAEQRAIAEVLSDAEAEVTALETRRDKTKLIKQGMMQELLTGGTRLVEAAP